MCKEDLIYQTILHFKMYNRDILFYSSGISIQNSIYTKQKSKFSSLCLLRNSNNIVTVIMKCVSEQFMLGIQYHYPNFSRNLRNLTELPNRIEQRCSYDFLTRFKNTSLRLQYLINYQSSNLFGFSMLDNYVEGGGRLPRGHAKTNNFNLQYNESGQRYIIIIVRVNCCLRPEYVLEIYTI